MELEISSGHIQIALMVCSWEVKAGVVYSTSGLSV